MAELRSRDLQVEKELADIDLDSYPGIRGGFMHVPFVPSQTVGLSAPAPSMCREDIARGIEAAIRAIAEHASDLVTAEGKNH